MKKVEVNGASFAERLRGGRAIRNLQQKDIAEICDVSIGTVSAWESGSVSARIDQIQKIAVALELPLPWLIGATDCMAQED